jgi:uncharacterized protein YbjT (DUF2867 family)
MKVLVVGGTGTVGTLLVKRLLTTGVQPRILTRSASRAAAVPPGAVAVMGDLSYPKTLQGSFTSVDRLVLITSPGPHETEEGLAAVEAARRSGMAHVTMMSRHDVEQCPEAAHFKSKIDIAQALANAGVPHTLVMPNDFFQNDCRFRHALVERGVYPYPIGSLGVSRVDARDVADVFAVVVTEAGHDGRRYPVVGPDLVTGRSAAATWARHLDRDVRYAGDDLDVWAAEASREMPAWLVRELRVMYAFDQIRGSQASEHDFVAQEKVLRHPPRRFDAFVAETARSWRALGAPTVEA